MNWIVGSKYKTRGGQIVEIIRCTQFFGIEVRFTSGETTTLDKSGGHLTHRDWDLVSLVGPTSASVKAPAPSK